MSQINLLLRIVTVYEPSSKPRYNSFKSGSMKLSCKTTNIKLQIKANPVFVFLDAVRDKNFRDFCTFRL